MLRRILIHRSTRHILIINESDSDSACFILFFRLLILCCLCFLPDASGFDVIYCTIYIPAFKYSYNIVPSVARLTS